MSSICTSPGCFSGRCVATYCTLIRILLDDPTRSFLIICFCDRRTLSKPPLAFPCNFAASARYVLFLQQVIFGNTLYNTLLTVDHTFYYTGLILAPFRWRRATLHPSLVLRSPICLRASYGLPSTHTPHGAIRLRASYSSTHLAYRRIHCPSIYPWTCYSLPGTNLAYQPILAYQTMNALCNVRY